MQFRTEIWLRANGTEAIVVNVLARTMIDDLKDDFHKINCVAVSTDAFNHGNKEIFPNFVRYFLSYKGIQVNVLGLEDQPGEASNIIVTYLTKILSENKLTILVN